MEQVGDSIPKIMTFPNQPQEEKIHQAPLQNYSNNNVFNNRFKYDGIKIDNIKRYIAEASDKIKKEIIVCSLQINLDLNL